MVAKCLGSFIFIANGTTTKTKTSCIVMHVLWCSRIIQMNGAESEEQLTTGCPTLFPTGMAKEIIIHPIYLGVFLCMLCINSFVFITQNKDHLFLSFLKLPSSNLCRICLTVAISLISSRISCVFSTAMFTY